MSTSESPAVDRYTMEHSPLLMFPFLIPFAFCSAWITDYVGFVVLSSFLISTSSNDLREKKRLDKKLSHPPSKTMEGNAKHNLEFSLS